MIIKTNLVGRLAVCDVSSHNDAISTRPFVHGAVLKLSIKIRGRYPLEADKILPNGQFCGRRSRLPKVIGKCRPFLRALTSSRPRLANPLSQHLRTYLIQALRTDSVRY